MFLDTTFLITLSEEIEQRRVGPAQAFLGRRRNEEAAVTVISLGEFAAGLERNQAAREFLSRFRIVTLKPEIALAAAEVDRELIRVGMRLGENDNWIAGFCRYYSQPLVTRDRDFARVPGLRRLAY
jgi:predicted nucleic acid-binding protein